MRQEPTIRRFISFFFLCLLLISSAPKTYFHDVLARHQDSSVCTEDLKDQACVHQQGYACHYDNLVVVAPFLAGTEPQLQPLDLSFFKSSSTRYLSYLHQESGLATGRGPPFAA